MIGSVLLQSGKGDIASALGGGGAQNAFGPRGAASTLARVTLIAASGFMILAFIFSVPGILGGGSVATDLDKDPLAPKTSPSPLASPSPIASPAPASTGQTTANPTPVASPVSGETGKDGKVEGKSENKSENAAKPSDETKKESPKTGDKDTKPQNK